MPKEVSLAGVSDSSAAFKGSQVETLAARTAFIKDIGIAYDEGATQLEIADAAGYSRQRIAQFLKERAEDAKNG